MILKDRLLVLTFCAFTTFLTLFFRVGALPFFGSDEPRYARIGQEMAESGDFVTPTLLGRPWLEKPPLLFWGEALSFRLFGVSERAARLPNALLAVLTGLAVALLASRAEGPRSGLLSYLVLLTSGMYVLFGRAASMDLPLTAAFTAAMVFGYLADRTREIGWSIATGVSLALAVLAKGPIAVLLFGAVFLLYFLGVNRIGITRRQFLAGGASVLLTAVPWFWMVGAANGGNFYLVFWVNHHLARFVTDLHHHVQPFWFYVPIVLAGAFPWIFFAVPSLREMWWNRDRLRDERIRIQFFLWVWILVPFLFFSASSSKLPGYVLPVLPPLALLAGLQWDRYIRGELGAYSTMKLQLALCAASSVILALVLVFGFHFVYDSMGTGAVVALPLLAAAAWGQREYSRKRPVSLFIVLAGGMALALALLYRQATPIVARYHSTAELARHARPFLSPTEPLVFYRAFHHSARYYADFQTTADTVNNLGELLEYSRSHPQERYWILTNEGGWMELARIAGARLAIEKGNFFLVELDGMPDVSELEEPVR